MMVIANTYILRSLDANLNIDLKNRVYTLDVLDISERGLHYVLYVYKRMQLMKLVKKKTTVLMLMFFFILALVCCIV